MTSPSPPLLEARALECVRGERTLFRALSFTLAAGGLLHVAGANGSGKTSLLRILCGLGAAQGAEGAQGNPCGVVLWRGAPLAAQRETFAHELTYVGHAAALKDDLTAAENLRLACLLAGVTAGPAAVREALATFGLAACLDLPARLLSQGQRRRAVLARLLLAEHAPLWILDEPFNALDAPAVAMLETVLAAHLDRGGLLVLTTHQDAPLTARASLRLDLMPEEAEA